jgi:NTP pyrophosphatase (non-canonical NTP hydrolase)
LEINELIEQAHKTAVEHGWWEEDRNFGEQIALMHSELSEALEEYRNYKDMKEIYHECKNNNKCLWKSNDGTACRHQGVCPFAKPCGIPTELADCIIRIADMCGRYGIDLEEALKVKMEYNKARPYRHGGKRA